MDFHEVVFALALWLAAASDLSTGGTSFQDLAFVLSECFATADFPGGESPTSNRSTTNVSTMMYVTQLRKKCTSAEVMLTVFPATLPSSPGVRDVHTRQMLGNVVVMITGFLVHLVYVAIRSQAPLIHIFRCPRGPCVAAWFPTLSQRLLTWMTPGLLYGATRMWAGDFDLRYSPGESLLWGVIAAFLPIFGIVCIAVFHLSGLARNRLQYHPLRGVVSGYLSSRCAWSLKPIGGIARAPTFHWGGMVDAMGEPPNATWIPLLVGFLRFLLGASLFGVAFQQPRTAALLPPGTASVVAGSLQVVYGLYLDLKQPLNCLTRNYSAFLVCGATGVAMILTIFDYPAGTRSGAPPVAADILSTIAAMASVVSSLVNIFAAAMQANHVGIFEDPGLHPVPPPPSSAFTVAGDDGNSHHMLPRQANAARDVGGFDATLLITATKYSEGDSSSASASEADSDPEMEVLRNAKELRKKLKPLKTVSFNDPKDQQLGWDEMPGADLPIKTLAAFAPLLQLPELPPPSTHESAWRRPRNPIDDADDGTADYSRRFGRAKWRRDRRKKITETILECSGDVPETYQLFASAVP